MHGVAPSHGQDFALSLLKLRKLQRKRLDTTESQLPTCSLITLSTNRTHTLWSILGRSLGMQPGIQSQRGSTNLIVPCAGQQAALLTVLPVPHELLLHFHTVSFSLHHFLALLEPLQALLVLLQLQGQPLPALLQQFLLALAFPFPLPQLALPVLQLPLPLVTFPQPPLLLLLELLPQFVCVSQFHPLLFQIPEFLLFQDEGEPRTLAPSGLLVVLQQ